MATKKLLVYVKHEEGDEAAHLNTKCTVPKSWRPGPVRKLLAFAVETYNGKHADTLLDKDQVHFECAGEILGLDDIVDQTIQPKAELKLVSGASPLIGSARQRIVDETKRKEEEAEAKRLFAVGKIKCQNFGCAQLFDPNDNEEGSCHHHVSPPFFHDCNKGWTCCRGKTAMDWDDFQKLPTCAVGKHSATPPKAKSKPKEETCVPCAAPTKSIENYNTNEGKAAVKDRILHDMADRGIGQFNAAGELTLVHVESDQTFLYEPTREWLMSSLETTVAAGQTHESVTLNMPFFGAPWRASTLLRVQEMIPEC